MLLQAEIVAAILGIIIAVIALAILASSIRVVPEFRRLVVFRLGRLVGIRGPGLVFLIPVIDQAYVVDLREQVIDVTKQTCITKDNAPVDIDLLIYLKVVDPEKVITQVQDFRQAAVGIATTTLRAVVGDIELDEVLAKREYINSVLRAKLDEVTARWGVKVTAVEIREIIPPSTVQSAMVKQIAAERERRAMITQADGEKQAAILKAEGQKQAAILQAEGERQAAILRAEGQAKALELVNEAASKLGHNALLLQYLEALKNIAASPSTKIVVPMELLSFLQAFLKEGEKR
ncbi:MULTISPECIES: SPFH domain-containing protein [Pyrobaculum]|uniref:SPFH domain, Band 7 family protein n=2 Tax=Pyrobaculum arsenaticum TaxID=121277 RepID=A4WJ61_PYRAR|nr:SPFH domain-containing protein [Pyrobaculum arsenaticum]ABP50428.1 SPFH domain, Band 7 family protein [Pyrobaculum arsenaticum DSM 13514]MCY0890416.1 SPFH domain-containing protein [Pyrobaculum arsenaticum]NYR14628.1 SPFH/Band 7/PHB domain protein [Pyrobaculum arsenaticum]